MSKFNYEKAYFVFVIPEFNALSVNAFTTFLHVKDLVEDLQQGRDLKIPLTDNIERLLNQLTAEELARLSRCSYYLGHWKPRYVEPAFDNQKGQSWKVSNCCDQVLRNKLKPLPNIQIHEGILRVTYEDKRNWLREEFALATEDNLNKFKNCGLSFNNVNTFEDNANKLKQQFNDLWDNPDSVETTPAYIDYLEIVKQKEKENIQKDFDNKIKKLNKQIEHAEKEKEFLFKCNDLYVPIDNVIYYSHCDEFCFGWREPLTEELKAEIKEKLKTIMNEYNITFK